MSSMSRFSGGYSGTRPTRTLLQQEDESDDEDLFTESGLPSTHRQPSPQEQFEEGLRQLSLEPSSNPAPSSGSGVPSGSRHKFTRQPHQGSGQDAWEVEPVRRSRTAPAPRHHQQRSRFNQEWKAMAPLDVPSSDHPSGHPAHFETSDSLLPPPHITSQSRPTSGTSYTNSTYDHYSPRNDAYPPHYASQANAHSPLGDMFDGDGDGYRSQLPRAATAHAIYDGNSRHHRQHPQRFASDQYDDLSYTRPHTMHSQPYQSHQRQNALVERGRSSSIDGAYAMPAGQYYEVRNPPGAWEDHVELRRTLSAQPYQSHNARAPYTASSAVRAMQHTSSESFSRASAMTGPSLPSIPKLSATPTVTREDLMDMGDWLHFNLQAQNFHRHQDVLNAVRDGGWFDISILLRSHRITRVASSDLIIQAIQVCPNLELSSDCRFVRTCSPLDSRPRHLTPSPPLHPSDQYIPGSFDYSTMPDTRSQSADPRFMSRRPHYGQQPYTPPRAQRPPLSPPSTLRHHSVDVPRDSGTAHGSRQRDSSAKRQSRRWSEMLEEANIPEQDHDLWYFMRLIRLHKYTDKFLGTSLSEMKAMTDKDLEDRGLTKGARGKLRLELDLLPPDASKFPRRLRRDRYDKLKKADGPGDDATPVSPSAAAPAAAVNEPEPVTVSAPTASPEVTTTA
eukprot:m.248631 g.248631  ORF g.248631 m.248631 type:complete len:674 (+) comp15416_c0_seq1:257-2278(+)